MRQQRKTDQCTWKASVIDAAAGASARPTGRQASRDCLQPPHTVRHPPFRLRSHARPHPRRPAEHRRTGRPAGLRRLMARVQGSHRRHTSETPARPARRRARRLPGPGDLLRHPRRTLRGFAVATDQRPRPHGFVIGHGYGGRVDAGSDLPLPLPGSAAIPPAAPGPRNSACARASLPIPPGTSCTAADPVTPTSSATAWPACGAPRPPSWNACPPSTAGSACSAQASAATSGRSHCRGTTMCGVIRKG